jgi:hypothetical protein
MIFRTRHVLGCAAGALLLIATSASAQPTPAARPVTPGRPVVPPAYRPGNTLPDRRLPGSDWWRIYPWSPYNAWRNPYWYPPYNGNYPYPPSAAYPSYLYPVPPPAPLPPLPPVPPLPIPGGGIGSSYR